MGRASDVFTQEQHAKLEFAGAMANVRSRFSNSDSPQFLAAFDALTEAALRFGTCELRMRRAERLDALGLGGRDVKHLKSTAMSNNKRGLAALKGVRPFVDELTRTKRGSKELAIWRESSPDLRAEWRDQVSQLNVSGENARHLVRVMDESCEAIDKHGAAGLGRLLSGRLAELEKQRRAPDRGTHEASFPFWKIIFVAAYFGIMVWAMYDLVTRGAPWWDFVLIAVCVSAMFMLVALGC